MERELTLWVLVVFKGVRMNARDLELIIAVLFISLRGPFFALVIRNARGETWCGSGYAECRQAQGEHV
jgi:hypothetical protein